MSEHEKIGKLIVEYLEKARLMQIATSNNTKPWICSVYFASDEFLNLYWISRPGTRHSLEIKENEKVAGTIVLPHTPGDDVRGIQFEGIAKELEKEEAKLGIRYYARRYKMPEKRVKTILDNTEGHICYKISPSVFILFDEVNFPKNPRQEYTV